MPSLTRRYRVAVLTVCHWIGRVFAGSNDGRFYVLRPHPRLPKAGLSSALKMASSTASGSHSILLLKNRDRLDLNPAVCRKLRDLNC